MPLPHTEFAVHLLTVVPVHVQPVSTVHALPPVPRQPSPLPVLPSSHTSLPLICPSPHSGIWQVVVHESLFSRSPSSHSSVPPALVNG